jgi:hypothetical protein
VSHSTAPETTVPDPVLAAERAHLQRAAECLTEMRTAASAVVDAGVDAWASERLGAARAERLRALAADPGVPPFFGRTDTPAEAFHIGRRHVRDATGDPVVIDWRAPMSRPFYQATAADTQGLVRRRRFGFAGGELTGYEDEVLAEGERSAPLQGPAASSRAVGGRGVLPFLRQEIERPRSGPMRDIVATIQPDQDDIVRAPLAESICVQGAPGTGKTAVGLHRAAYLLYNHGGQLARTGVLVVGPNRAFLRYIEQVLPTLGEVDVEQTTVADLTARVPVRAEDPPEVAVLKGETLAGLGRPATVVRPLTRGYRVPGEVLDFANRLLPLIAPDLPAATAVRMDPAPSGSRRRPRSPVRSSTWSTGWPPSRARSGSSAPTDQWPTSPPSSPVPGSRPPC